MNSTISKFNKTVRELITDLKEVYPNLNSKLDGFSEKYDLTGEDQSYLSYYLTNVQKHNDLIASRDISLFEKVNVLEDINLHFIMTEPESESNREVVWKYVEALYLYAHQYIKDNLKLDNAEDIVKGLKDMGFNEDYFKDQTESLFKIMENLKTDKPKENEESPQLPPEMEGMKETLFGGMIGSLAKEIATEIDPNTLNIDANNPQELLQNLFSGGNNNLMGLVQNISGKLQKRIDDGQIDQAALFNEANAIMGNFQKMPGFENMASGMGGAGAGAGGLDPAMMMNLFAGLTGGIGGNAKKKETTTKNLSLLPKNHPKRKGGK
jgi:uncharacterized protein YeeX (DUF496 family)